MKIHCTIYSSVKALILGALIMLAPAALSNSASAQNHSSEAYTYFMLPNKLQKDIVFLTSEEQAGRATGSEGGSAASKYISDAFSDAGLEPYGLSYYQSFTATNGKRGVNVIGKISSDTGSNEYIIVGAHYDHRGTINGQIYRGADDNASGTAALIAIARAASKMKHDGLKIGKNILFIAFDGKELSMSGSSFFVRKTKINYSNICVMLNIDQIGTSLAAPNDSKDYIIAIGNEYLDDWAGKQLDFSNRSCKIGLDIDYSFYGSETFRKLFYKMSDQAPFAEKNIPAILFTAGINEHTYKTSDTEAVIEYPVLSKRVMLIYYFLYQLIS